MKAVVAALSSLTLPTLFGRLVLFSLLLAILLFVFGPALLIMLFILAVLAFAVWSIARDFGGIAAFFRLLRMGLLLLRNIDKLAPAIRLAADGLDRSTTALREAASAVRKVNSTVVTAGHSMAALEMPAFKPETKDFKIPTGPTSSQTVSLVVGLKQSPGLQPLAGIRHIVDQETARIDQATSGVIAASNEIGAIAEALRRLADDLQARP